MALFFSKCIRATVSTVHSVLYLTKYKVEGLEDDITLEYCNIRLYVQHIYIYTTIAVCGILLIKTNYHT